MPRLAAAWVSEPFSSMASSSAIFPGPSEHRGARSTRNRMRSMANPRDALRCIRAGTARVDVGQAMEIARNAGGTVARVLGYAAAACWLASWVLPVVSGYPGYAAFQAALTGPFNDL